MSKLSDMSDRPVIEHAHQVLIARTGLSRNGGLDELDWDCRWS
jgi:hypothetical protein